MGTQLHTPDDEEREDPERDVAPRSPTAKRLARALHEAICEHGSSQSFACSELDLYGFPWTMAAGRLARRALPAVEGALNDIHTVEELPHVTLIYERLAYERSYRFRVECKAS